MMGASSAGGPLSPRLELAELKAQLVDRDAEIRELKAANQEQRELCVRLQSALEISSEQLHDAVAAQQGLSLLSTPTPSSEEGSNVLFKQIPSALARTPQLISRAVELARRRNSSESPKEEAGLVPSLRSQRQNSTEDLAAVPVDEIAQPDSTEGAEGSTLAAVSNLNSDYSPQDKTSDSSGNVDPLRDRALRTVPSTTTGLPRVGVGLELNVDLKMGLPCVIGLERGSATALRNKIKVGDYLVGIKNIDSHDFERTEGLALARVRDLLLGAQGTGVALRLKRQQKVLAAPALDSTGGVSNQGTRKEGTEWKDEWVEYDCALLRAGEPSADSVNAEGSTAVDTVSSNDSTESSAAEEAGFNTDASDQAPADESTEMMLEQERYLPLARSPRLTAPDESRVNVSPSEDALQREGQLSSSPPAAPTTTPRPVAPATTPEGPGDVQWNLAEASVAAGKSSISIPSPTAMAPAPDVGDTPTKYGVCSDNIPPQAPQTSRSDVDGAAGDVARLVTSTPTQAAAVPTAKVLAVKPRAKQAESGPDACSATLRIGSEGPGGGGKEEEAQQLTESSHTVAAVASAAYRAKLNWDEERLLQAAQQWAGKNEIPPSHMQDLPQVITLIQRAQVPHDEIEIGAAIDQGTFSIIERGRWRGKAVAIKKLNKASFQTTQNQLHGSFHQLMRGLMLELDVLVALSHPNVCPYLGCVARFPPGQDMVMGMVFELMKGNMFSALHSEAGCELDLRARLQILRDVAAGLTYLHSQMILHRDLSSRNILLNDAHRACIADFGCARRLVSDNGYLSTTISGSPGYMSLEQLTGAPLTLKADVYAFGTLMWETCSLQVPFVKQGNDIYKIRALVQAGTRLPALAPAAFDAHSKASQLHARFSLLIRRATNTHPKARPSMPEAEEMMSAAFDDSWTATSWELGRADLQSRLVALYTRINPEKVADANALSEEWYGNEEELNNMIMQRYSTTLARPPLAGSKR